jgi:hypothetical protein
VKNLILILLLLWQVSINFFVHLAQHVLNLHGYFDGRRPKPWRSPGFSYTDSPSRNVFLRNRYRLRPAKRLRESLDTPQLFAGATRASETEACPPGALTIAAFGGIKVLVLCEIEMLLTR